MTFTIDCCDALRSLALTRMVAVATGLTPFFLRAVRTEDITPGGASDWATTATFLPLKRPCFAAAVATAGSNTFWIGVGVNHATLAWASCCVVMLPPITGVECRET